MAGKRQSVLKDKKTKMAVAESVKQRGRVRNFLASDAEWEEIKAKADKYAQGNTSAWLRYAGKNAKADPSDMVPVE